MPVSSSMYKELHGLCARHGLLGCGYQDFRVKSKKTARTLVNPRCHREGFAGVTGDSDRALVLRFYRNYNPSKLGQIDDVLERYHCREERMWRILKEKCVWLLVPRRMMRVCHGVWLCAPSHTRSLICSRLLARSLSRFDPRYQKNPHVLVEISKPIFEQQYDSAIKWLRRDQAEHMTEEDKAPGSIAQAMAAAFGHVW